MENSNDYSSNKEMLTYSGTIKKILPTTASSKIVGRKISACQTLKLNQQQKIKPKVININKITKTKLHKSIRSESISPSPLKIASKKLKADKIPKTNLSSPLNMLSINKNKVKSKNIEIKTDKHKSIKNKKFIFDSHLKSNNLVKSIEEKNPNENKRSKSKKAHRKSVIGNKVKDIIQVKIPNEIRYNDKSFSVCHTETVERLKTEPDSIKRSQKSCLSQELLKSIKSSDKKLIKNLKPCKTKKPQTIQAYAKEKKAKQFTEKINKKILEDFNERERFNTQDQLEKRQKSFKTKKPLKKKLSDNNHDKSKSQTTKLTKKEKKIHNLKPKTIDLKNSTYQSYDKLRKFFNPKSTKQSIFSHSSSQDFSSSLESCKSDFYTDRGEWINLLESKYSGTNSKFVEDFKARMMKSQEEFEYKTRIDGISEEDEENKEKVKNFIEIENSSSESYDFRDRELEFKERTFSHKVPPLTLSLLKNEEIDSDNDENQDEFYNDSEDIIKEIKMIEDSSFMEGGLDEDYDYEDSRNEDCLESDSDNRIQWIADDKNTGKYEKNGVVQEKIGKVGDDEEYCVKNKQEDEEDMMKFYREDCELVYDDRLLYKLSLNEQKIGKNITVDLKDFCVRMIENEEICGNEDFKENGQGEQIVKNNDRKKQLEENDDNDKLLEFVGKLCEQKEQCVEVKNKNEKIKVQIQCKDRVEKGEISPKGLILIETKGGNSQEKLFFSGKDLVSENDKTKDSKQVLIINPEKNQDPLQVPILVSEKVQEAKKVPSPEKVQESKQVTITDKNKEPKDIFLPNSESRELSRLTPSSEKTQQLSPVSCQSIISNPSILPIIASTENPSQSIEKSELLINQPLDSNLLSSSSSQDLKKTSLNLIEKTPEVKKILSSQTSPTINSQNPISDLITQLNPIVSNLKNTPTSQTKNLQILSLFSSDSSDSSSDSKLSVNFYSNKKLQETQKTYHNPRNILEKLSLNPHTEELKSIIITESIEKSEQVELTKQFSHDFHKQKEIIEIYPKASPRPSPRPSSKMSPRITPMNIEKSSLRFDNTVALSPNTKSTPVVVKFIENTKINEKIESKKMMESKNLLELPEIIDKKSTEKGKSIEKDKNEKSAYSSFLENIDKFLECPDKIGKILEDTQNCIETNPESLEKIPYKTLKNMPISSISNLSIDPSPLNSDTIAKTTKLLNKPNEIISKPYQTIKFTYNSPDIISEKDEPLNFNTLIEKNQDKYEKPNQNISEMPNRNISIEINIDDTFPDIINQEISYFLKIISFENLEKEVNSSIEYILAYLDCMAKVLKDNEVEVLDAINTPMFLEPVSKLALLQDMSIDTFMRFHTLELILPVELCSELKMMFQSLNIPSRQIYLQMLFDCVNEALNYIRPFGVNGIPDPWCNSPRILFGESDLENVFNRVTAYLIKWSSCRAGCFHNFESQNNDEYLQSLREEKMSSLLCIDVRDEEPNWLLYNEEETQIKVITANKIFKNLLKETLDFL
ncbi:hypothetical protein SteCoe_2287 [Stentor coeruleus]|uniref:Uncharacterized protein n=1 Tax=Stentor coeruleus TaxID=5963 RepID=A0A1R2CZV6_9CILI|nr:hypothetical protein SteCoe_2287 [Stentor coeruleus]